MTKKHFKFVLIEYAKVENVSYLVLFNIMVLSKVGERFYLFGKYLINKKPNKELKQIKLSDEEIYEKQAKGEIVE